MARPLLPPRGIFTGSRWIFDAQLPAGIKETLLQIMALTWASPGRATPPLSYAQLQALTGKDARTLRGHFSALRTYHAALRLQRAGAGQFIIVLAGWLFSNRDDAAGAPCAPGGVLPVPVNHDQEEESFIALADEFVVLPHPDHTPEAPPAEIEKPLSAAMQKKIQALGVFPILMDEVFALARKWKYSDRELKALVEWCKDDQPERPGGLFIGRMRAGGRAPAIYATAPCRRCGLRGKHAPECPARYALS